MRQNKTAAAMHSNAFRQQNQTKAVNISPEPNRKRKIKKNENHSSQMMHMLTQ